MKFGYFMLMITGKKTELKLKRLGSYSETDEIRQYVKITNKLIKKCEESGESREAIRTMKDKLIIDFAKIYSLTYISCFYHRCIPCANMLKTFGGEFGISVGFDKSDIMKSVENCKANVARYGREPLNIWKHQFMNYISGTEQDFNVKIEKFNKIVCKTNEDNCVAMRDSVVDFLFNTTHYYELENEYRIIRGVNPHADNSRETVSMPLLSTAIKKVAVHKSNLPFMQNFIESLGDSCNYKIKIADEEKDVYYEHPLILYKVQPK